MFRTNIQDLELKILFKDGINSYYELNDPNDLKSDDTFDPKGYYEYIPKSLNGKSSITSLKLPKFVYDRYNLHRNQYTTAIQVLRYFESGIHDVILTAQMQSGKTGVAKYLVHFFKETYQEIIDEKFNKVQIYYICGMNDTDLKDQAVREFQDLLPIHHILFSKDLQKFCDEYQGYRQASDLLDNYVLPNLIIIDESHYAGLKDSLIDRFMNIVRTEYTYVLSISATACAEIATMNLYSKSLVYLPPDQNYYGITDLFQRGMIFQSIKLDSRSWDSYEQLVDLIANEYQEQQSFEWKYNIIRLPSKFYYQDLQDKIGELDLNVTFLNYHSELIENRTDISDFNQLVQDPPSGFTIIWIYGSLRASKQLNTKHIGFVHDTAKSRPDIIAQSLMGRIFGYKKEIHDVKCYTDLESAKKIYHWIKSQYLREYIPSGCTHVKQAYTEKVKIWKLHPPMYVLLPEDLIKYYRYLKFQHKNRYPYKDELIQDILVLNPDLHSILNNPVYLPGKHGGLMILTEFNRENSYRQHFTANYRAYLDRRPVRGFCTDGLNKNAYYIFVDLNVFSSTIGTVLIIHKTNIGNLYHQDKENHKNHENLDLNQDHMKVLNTTSADYVNVNIKSRFSNNKITIK